MKKYVVIFLMKISLSNPIDKLLTNIICVIFWGSMCMVSIQEYVITNPYFQYSGPLLVVLRVSCNVDFGDTREVLLIGP